MDSTVEPPNNTTVMVDMPAVAEDLGPPDMGPPDMPEEEDMPTVTFCSPGEKGCSMMGDEIVRVVCVDDGSEFEVRPCPERTECEDTEDERGACVDIKICNEGETRCFDTTTVETCRPGGTQFRTDPCMPGESCINGACFAGAVNGASCAMNDDCAGAECHCDAEEACGAKWAPSYCTSRCTNADSCSASEHCIATDVHQLDSMPANYNHCVQRCQGTCAIGGLECKWAPTYDEMGDVVWAESCYFPEVKEVGEPCETNEECIGGTCLEGYLGVKVCSRRCEMDGCPEGAGCVKINATEAWCVPTCTRNEECPGDFGQARCILRQFEGGGGGNVCAPL